MKENVIITKRNKRKIIATVISTLGAVFVIIGAFFTASKYYKKLNIVTYKNYNLFQYVNGQKFEYTGEISLTRDNEITKLENNEIIIESNVFPIYYSDDPNLVLFPIDMGLISLDNVNQSYKINHFSQIKFMVDETGKSRNSVAIVYKGKEIDLKESFLYDGENLYFFTFPVSVIIDEEEYNLSSGSYIIVNYKEQIEIYSKADDKYYILEEHQNDVIATLEDYKINLSTDMVITNAGNRLLIKNVKNLPVYE